MPALSRPHSIVFALLLSVSLSGCGEKPASAQTPAGTPPPEVAVVTVTAEDVTVNT